MKQNTEFKFDLIIVIHILNIRLLNWREITTVREIILTVQNTEIVPQSHISQEVQL